MAITARRIFTTITLAFRVLALTNTCLAAEPQIDPMRFQADPMRAAAPNGSTCRTKFNCQSPPKAPELQSNHLQQMASANDQAWPRLGDSSPSSGICATALEIADSAYRSDNFHLYALPPFPKVSGVVFALQPPELELPNSLVVDQTAFREIPKSNEHDNLSIYWQTRPQHGLRYVMDEEGFGWRGNQYTLYAVKEDVTPDQFIEGIRVDAQQQAFTPLIDEGWRSPLMLQEQRTGEVWAIDVGRPYVSFDDWRIYWVGQDGAGLRCAIHFPPGSKNVTALLPRSVQKLANNLDATLGSGANEGTLEPTAGIRVEVSHMWANVAMRPWAALTAQPLDGRGQVDAGLTAYSRKGTRYLKLYRDIYATYPRAELALTRYYRAKFGKDPGEAVALAKRALDLAFRMYFVFPKGDGL